MSEEDFENVMIDVCDGNYMLWNSDHVAFLRNSYHIVGNCIGSLPWKPRQNSHLSMPVQLTKFEAAFLIENRVAKLRGHSMKNEEVICAGEKQKVCEERKLQWTAQLKLLQEQKSSELDSMSPMIMQGKKMKHGNNSNAMTSKMVDFQDFERFKEGELEKTNLMGIEQSWVEMLVSSSYSNVLNFTDIGGIEFDGLELLQYQVFCDLQSQGLYVAHGSKFGGHFLVYPGDPFCYHSFYIAFCVPHKHKITGYEYSALGRLASTVKKTLLLCSKTESGPVRYFSISWTGLVP